MCKEPTIAKLDEAINNQTKMENLNDPSTIKIHKEATTIETFEAWQSSTNTKHTTKKKEITLKEQKNWRWKNNAQDRMSKPKWVH